MKTPSLPEVVILERSPARIPIHRSERPGEAKDPHRLIAVPIARAVLLDDPRGVTNLNR